MSTILMMLAAGFVLASLLMVVVWAVARRIGNNGIVDIAWSGSFLILVTCYAVLSPSPTAARTVLLVAMVAAWSLRLTVYLYRRVMAHHPVEDSRYQDLRRRWQANLDGRFFVFFQAQAAAAVAFSLPFAISAADPSPTIGAMEAAGAALWFTGLVGETVADRQLARFRADAARAAEVCQEGLWRYSRHPNYFFEWLTWCGFAVFALGAPWGSLGSISPALMLFTLLRVTGIPATEAAAIARRGDRYRAYQRTTSAFVPWFTRA